MKKMLSLLILTVLLTSFTACGENNENVVSESTEVVTETEIQTEEETTQIITEKETEEESEEEMEEETETTETETTETETSETSTETTETETTATETETAITETAETVTEPASTDISATSEPASTDVSVTSEAVQPVNPTMMHFILDAQSNCIHANAECSSAKKITDENYVELDINDTELQYYNNIYWACDECFPENLKSLLPKF